MIARPEQFPPEDGDALPCVPFVPHRCPFCRKHKPFTYGRYGRVRYHRCQACNRKYRSVELGAADVPNFTPPEDGATG